MGLCPERQTEAAGFCSSPGAALGMAIGAVFATAEMGIQMLSGVARAALHAVPKVGSAGGPGAGKEFPRAVQDAARAEAHDACVFCGEATVRSKTPTPNRSNIDHAIPKARGGNNTLPNAQNTCQTCNLKKGTMTTEEYLKKTGGGPPIAFLDIRTRLQNYSKSDHEDNAARESHLDPVSVRVAWPFIRDRLGGAGRRRAISPPQRSILCQRIELWRRRQHDNAGWEVSRPWRVVA
jgi:hypothetical protein